MKKVLALVLASVLVMSLAACAAPAAAPAAEAAPAAAEAAAPAAEAAPAATEAATEAAAAAEAAAPAAEAAGYKIGMTNCTMDSPFYGILCRTAEEACKAKGLDFMYLDAASDLAKQNNDITDMLNQGCNIIVINPVDPDGVATGMQACEAAGVPVFTVDRFCDGNYVAHVGSDNELMGRLNGQVAVDALGGTGNAKGKVLEVMGATGCKVMKARSKGFHDIIDAEAGIEVVQTPYTEYTRSIAVECVTDILQTTPDFDLVYSHCDDCAVGTYNCFCDIGRDDIKVCSVDGLREYVEMVADPSTNCLSTTSNDPIAIAYLLADVLEEYVTNGKTADSVYLTNNDLITKDIAQKYLDKSDATFVGNLDTKI